MRAEAPESDAPRDVLRAVRPALDGAGPAVLLGGDPAPVEVPPGTAVVVTTSGSSGYPKRVVLSRSALIASATATAARVGEGRWLLALPAGYVAGLQVLVRSLLAGHEPAILAGRFSPEAFAAASRLTAGSIGGARIPTYTSLVPAQLSALLDAEDATVLEALRSYEAVLIGGQALPVPVRERAAAAGVRIVRTYGSSETSGGCVYDGLPLDGVRMRIVEREVQLNGPMLAEGYLGDPERTAASFVRDDAGVRWYRTGDAGEIVDGALRVTGRLDNVLVSGGVNVSLDRVEQVVRELPGMAAAVVVPAPHPRWGEAPVVVLPGGGDADTALAAVRDAVGAALGPAARPDRVVFVPELPLLASGKPDRLALRVLVARSA